MSTITIAPHAAPRVRHQAPAQRRTPARSRSQVRLTRRGRLVVFVLAFVLVAAAAVLIAAGSAATRTDGGAPAIEVVTVAPGETLWAIASDVAADTGDDVRDVMARIQQLNTLDGSLVYAGQQLRVPTE